MYLPGEGVYTKVTGTGLGYRTNATPQSGDTYLQANVGAGPAFGREQGRFSGGQQMFQLRGSLVHQIGQRFSARVSPEHYSNADIVLRPKEVDAGEDFVTLGVAYVF